MEQEEFIAIPNISEDQIETLKKLFNEDDDEKTLNWEEVTQNTRIPHDESTKFNCDHIDVNETKNVEVLEQLKEIMWEELEIDETPTKESVEEKSDVEKLVEEFVKNNPDTTKHHEEIN